MATTAKPTDMPGANASQSGSGAADSDDATSTGAADDDGADGADENADGATDSDPMAELERLRRVHKDERKWERMAKAAETKALKAREDAENWRKNRERVAKLDEIEAQNRTEAENLRLELERERNARAQAESRERRSRIAAEFGVPARAVLGDTEEDMRESAQEYQDAVAAGIEAQLKARNIGPAAPASAVTSNGKPDAGKQLHQSDIEGMNRKQIMQAYRSGQLNEALGRST